MDGPLDGPADGFKQTQASCCKPVKADSLELAAAAGGGELASWLAASQRATSEPGEQSELGEVASCLVASCCFQLSLPVCQASSASSASASARKSLAEEPRKRRSLVGIRIIIIIK